jgi:hypothetical protein
MNYCAFCGSHYQIITHNNLKGFKHFCFKENASDEPSCFLSYFFYKNAKDWSRGIPFAITSRNPPDPEPDIKHPCGYCGSIEFSIFNPETPNCVFNYPYFCKITPCFRKAYLYMKGLRESPPPFILVLTNKKRSSLLQFFRLIFKKRHNW